MSRHLEQRSEGRVAIASVTGDLDAANSAGVAEEIGRSVPNAAIGLVIDLTDTGYVDSSGIELLFRMQRLTASRRQRLAVVVPESSQLRRLLAMTGVDAAIGLFADCDEAVRALSDDASAPRPAR